MNIAPGIRKYLGASLLVGLLAALRRPRYALTGLLLAGGVVAFHRDPERTPPEAGILCPADGRVSVIREEDERVRVGVFMNLTDVHVNRAPTAGTVQRVEHSPGRHLPAFTKESERNERVVITFEETEVTLIAGAVARRVHPYVSEGQRVDRGERIGHISFSSRVDVLLPPEVDLGALEVSKGEKVSAGETVLVDGQSR